MSRFLKSSFVIFSFLLMSHILVACNAGEFYREESERRIAAPVFLLERTVEANKFNLHVHERIYREGQPAMVYIAGDGDDAMTFERDPGPVEPVALRLAAQDPKVNVIHLSRPCQITGEADQCPSRFWGDDKYGEEALAAMDVALSKLKGKHKLTGFHFVGYEGGAVIAAALAARRDDVRSIRTVAGILDTKYYASLNGMPYDAASTFNPTKYAPLLTNVPQHHFVGQLDSKVTSALYHSYEQAMGSPNCSKMTLVDNANHVDGWTEQWKVLLALPVECPYIPRKAIALTPVDNDGTGVTKIFK